MIARKSNKMTKRFAEENFPEDIQRKADQMNLEESAIPPYTVPEPESVSGMDFLQQSLYGRCFCRHGRAFL